LLKFQGEARLGFSLPKKLVERVQSATKCGDYLWPFTAEFLIGRISWERSTKRHLLFIYYFAL
jgi:hypothetical protein